MGRRGAKPQMKVSTEWSPELAYAVGLITTDGCLSSDGRHIDFTSKDRPLIKTFRTCLGIKNRIGRKTSGYTNQNDYYRVQFGDVNFYNWLTEIGLSSRKSKVLGRLSVPDQFFFDFFRGVFDGDGTIYSFWDPRWHSSFMYYLKIASASPRYLYWLRQTIRRLIDIEGKVREATRAYELVYAKAGTRSLVHRMYPAADIPRLERKFAKIQKIFTIDDTHNERPGVGTW